jgi:hypothetical protein
MSSMTILNNVVANMYTFIEQDSMITKLDPAKFETFIKQLAIINAIERAPQNDQKYINNISTFCREAHLELLTKKRLPAAAIYSREVKHAVKDAMMYDASLFQHSVALLLMLRHTSELNDFIQFCNTTWLDIFKKYHTGDSSTIVANFRRVVLQAKYGM